MNSKRVSVFVLLQLTGVLGASGAVSYSCVDLGNLNGLYGIGNDINNGGQVACYAISASGHNHGFLYSAGLYTDLSPLGGTDNNAAAINDNGQVVGYRTASGLYKAFVYSSGTMTTLSINANYSSAQAINNNGLIVGEYGMSTGNSDIHGFLYNAGTVTDLGGLGGNYTTPFGINTSGQIVGYSRTTNGVDHPFLYSGGRMMDLGTLWGTSGEATAINDSGQVVGLLGSPSVNSRAFLYSNGQMIDLGTMGGSGAYSAADGINNFGQIVGQAQNGQFQMHAFLYSNGVMLDLNNLIVTNAGWTLKEAKAINDNGQIVGLAVNTAGDQHAFLLTPIPEPAAVSLLSLGAAVCFVIRRPR